MILFEAMPFGHDEGSSISGGGKPSVSIRAELLESIVRYFQARRVILFGSRARGNASVDSDIDLLVELDDDVHVDQPSAKAVLTAERSYCSAVDIIPCRSAVLAERARAIGFFAHTILRDGVTVYERR